MKMTMKKATDAMGRELRDAAQPDLVPLEDARAIAAQLVNDVLDVGLEEMEKAFGRWQLKEIGAEEMLYHYVKWSERVKSSLKPPRQTESWL